MHTQDTRPLKSTVNPGILFPDTLTLDSVPGARSNPEPPDGHPERAGSIETPCSRPAPIEAPLPRAPRGPVEHIGDQEALKVIQGLFLFPDTQPMDTPSSLSPQLQEAILAEAQAHGFDETATRWLALLLQTDPTLPAPTAGAMVARVRGLPLGADLAALDATLHHLGGRSLAELTTSERRVTAMLLADLLAQAHALLAALRPAAAGPGRAGP